MVTKLKAPQLILAFSGLMEFKEKGGFEAVSLCVFGE